ncbi:phospholipase/carboxylesterase [Diplocarpon rosae]|nr:phospholipase/carboxylesterase [Diplocarpon rosae]
MAIYPELHLCLPTASHRNVLILPHETSMTDSSSDFYKSTTKVVMAQCRFVFPTGTSQKTTMFGGKQTNAWFKMTDFSDWTTGEAKMIVVKEEIELLHRGESHVEEKEKVILAGFSQDSAMGAILLLSRELEYLGVSNSFSRFVGLSGWLLFRCQIEAATVAGKLLARQESAMDLVQTPLHLDAEWRVNSKAS